MTAWLIEDNSYKKYLFGFLTVIGVFTGAYLFISALTEQMTAQTPASLGGHVAYIGYLALFPGFEYYYFMTACLGLILSSNRIACIFGLTLALSFIFTILNYTLGVLTSIWCFYAAWCSLVIVVGLFLDSKKQKRAVVY